MVDTSARTSFGTQTALVGFEILYTGELLPTWEQESYTSAKHVPGGNVTVLQLLGMGPLTVTWTLEFITAQDYLDMTALVQTRGTLRIPQSVAEPFGDDRDLSGVLYTEFPDVTLIALGGAGVDISGAIEAQATFYREGRA